MKSTQLSLLFVLLVCKGINDGACHLDQSTQSLRNDVKNQLTNLWDAMAIYHSVFTFQPSSKALTSCCQTTSHTPHLDLFFTFGQHMRDLMRSSIVSVIKLMTNPFDHLTECDYTPGSPEGLTPQEDPPVPTPDLPSAQLPFDAAMPPYTMIIHDVPQAGGYATEKYEEPRRKSGIIFSKPKLRYRHKVYKCRLRSHRASRTTDMVHFIDTNDDNSTSWLAPGVALGFLITVLIHLTYRVSYEQHYKQMKALRKNMMAVLATSQPYCKRYQHRCGRRCRGKDVAECHKAWMALNRNSFMRTRSEGHTQSSSDHEGGSDDQTNASRTREQFQVEESQTTSVITDSTQASCRKRADVLDSASWSNMSDTLDRSHTTCSNKTELQDNTPTSWSDGAGTLERTQTYWNNKADMHDGPRTDTSDKVETLHKAKSHWSDEDELLEEIPVPWSKDAHLFEETQAYWSSDSEGLATSTDSEKLAKTHVAWSSEDSASDSNVKNEKSSESSVKSRGSKRRKRFRSSQVHSEHHIKSCLDSEDTWLSCRSGIESVRSSTNCQPNADYEWTHFPNSDVGLPQVLPWDNDDAYSEAHGVHKTPSLTPSSHSSLGEEMRGPWVSTSLSFIVYDLDIINDIPNEVLEVLSCDKSLCEKHPHNRYHYLGRKVIVQRLPALDLTLDQQPCDKTTSTSFIPELPMSAFLTTSTRMGVVCTQTQTLCSTSITIQTQTSPRTTSSDVNAKETVKLPLSRIPTPIIMQTEHSAASSRDPSPKVHFGLRQPDQSTPDASPKVQRILRHPDPSSSNSREPSPTDQSALRHPDKSFVSSGTPTPKVQSGLRHPDQCSVSSRTPTPKVQSGLRSPNQNNLESSPIIQTSSLCAELNAAQSMESSLIIQTSSLCTEQNAAKSLESSPIVQTILLCTEKKVAKSLESSPIVQTISLCTEQNAAKSRGPSPKVYTKLLHTNTCTAKSQEPSLHSPTRLRHDNLVMGKESPSKQYIPDDFIRSEVETRPLAGVVNNKLNAVKSRDTSQESRSSYYYRGTKGGASRFTSTNAQSDKAMRQTREFISSPSSTSLASSASPHHGDNKTRARMYKAEMSHLSANTSGISRPVKEINAFKETDNNIDNITKWWSEKPLISYRDPTRVSSSNSSELDQILRENMTEVITPLTEAQIVASEFFDVDFDEDARSLSRTSIITGSMCQESIISSVLEKKQNGQIGNKSTFERSPHSEYPPDSEIQESKHSNHKIKTTSSLRPVTSVSDTTIAKHDNQCLKDIHNSSAPGPSKESTGWRDVTGSGPTKIRTCTPAVKAAAADFFRDESLDYVVPDESLQARNNHLSHAKDSTTVTDHGHEHPLHNGKGTPINTLQFKSIKEKDPNADERQESENEEVSKIMLTTLGQKKPKTDFGQPIVKNNESQRLNARFKFLSIRNAFEQRFSPSSKESPLTKKQNVSPSQNEEETDKIESENNQFEFVPIFSFSSKPPDESTSPDGEKPSKSSNEKKEERNQKSSAEDMSAEIKVPESPEAPKKEPYQSLSKASNKDISPPWEVSSRAKNAVFSPIGWSHPKPEISSILRVQSRDSMEEVSDGASSTYLHKNDESQVNQASTQASTRHSQANTDTFSRTSLSCISNSEWFDESRQNTCTSLHESMSEFQAGQDTCEEIALKQVKSSSVDFQDSSDTGVSTLVSDKGTTVSFGTEQLQSNKGQYDYSTIATGISESISELKAMSTSWLSNTIQAINQNTYWPISSETSFARTTQSDQSETVWHQISRKASNNVPGISTQTLQEPSTSSAGNVAGEAKTSIPALQRPRRLKHTLRKSDFTKTSLSSAKSRGSPSTLIPVPKSKSRLPVACATSGNSQHSSSSSKSSFKTASAGTLDISLKTFPPSVKTTVDKANRQEHETVSTNRSSTDVQLPSKTIQSHETNEQTEHSRTNTVRGQIGNGHDCSGTLAILNKNSEIIEKMKHRFTPKQSHTNPQSISQQSINGIRNLIFKKDTQVQEQEERDNEDLRSSHAFPVHAYAPKSNIVQSEDRQLNKDQKHKNNQTCRDLLGNDIFEDNKDMAQTGGINIATGSDILVETFFEAFTASSFSQRSKNTPFDKRESPVDMIFAKRESPVDMIFAKRESPVDMIFSKRESPVDMIFSKRESPVDANTEEAKLIQSLNSLQENLTKNSHNPPKVETGSQLSISQNLTTSPTEVISTPEYVCNTISKQLSPLIARKIKKLENSLLIKKAPVQHDQKPVRKLYSYLNESAAPKNNSLSENTLNEQSVPANKTRTSALKQPSKLPHLVKNTNCIVQSQADCVKKELVRRLIACNVNAKDNISQNHSSNTSPPVFCMEDQFFSPEPSFGLWSEVGNLCHQAIRQTDDNYILYNCKEEVGGSSCNVNVSQMNCSSSDSDSSIVSDEEALYKCESEAECQSTDVNSSNILYLHSDSNTSISVSVKDAVDNCENEAECQSTDVNASNILYLHFDSGAPVILDKDIMFNYVRDTEHTYCNANTRNTEYVSSDSETSPLSDGIHTEPCTSFSTITEEIRFFVCHYSGQIFPSNIVKWKESNVHRNVVSNFHENRLSAFDCKSNSHGISVTDHVESHIQDRRHQFATNDDDKEYFTPLGCDNDTTTDFDKIRLSSPCTNSDETTDFDKENFTLFSNDEEVATGFDEERLTSLKYGGNETCEVNKCSFTPLVCASNITNDFGKDNFSTLIFTLLSCDNNITSDLDKGYLSTLSFNGNMKSETDKEIFTQFTRSNHMRYNTKTPLNAKSLISSQQQPHLSCCKPTDDCVSSNIVTVNMDLKCCSMSERGERKSYKKYLEQKSDSLLFHLGKLHLHSNHLDNTAQKYIPLDNGAMAVADLYSASHKLCRLTQINTIDSGGIHYSHTCEQFTTGTGATDLTGKPLVCARCIMLSQDVIYTLSTLDDNIVVPIEENEDVLSPVCSYILLPSSSLSGILEYYRASKTGADDFGGNLFHQSYLGGSVADPRVKERNIDLILSPSDLLDSNVHFLYNNLRQDKNIGFQDRARLELTHIWNVDWLRMKTKTCGARGRLNFTNLWADNALPSKLDGNGALWNVNITHNPTLNLPAILNFQIPMSRPQGVSTVLSVPLSLPSIDYRTDVKENITSINRPLLMPGHNRVFLRMCRNLRTPDKLCCIFKSLTHCVVYTIR